MAPKPVLIALSLFALLSSCTPLIIGAGAAVATDAIIEQQKGGDGLF